MDEKPATAAQPKSRRRWCQYSLRSLLIAVVVLSLPCCLFRIKAQESQRQAAPALTHEQSVPNELPRDWSLEEIAKETPPYGADGRVYVLAWKVETDDRPLRVESCLVLKVIDKDDGFGRWCLAHLYRRPDEKKPEWRLSSMHVSGKEGTKYFPGLWIFHCKRIKERPTNKVIYASLSWEDAGWNFEQEDGWRFVSCCVCEKSWYAAIGESPTKFFGRK